MPHTQSLFSYIFMTHLSLCSNQYCYIIIHSSPYIIQIVIFSTLLYIPVDKISFFFLRILSQHGLTESFKAGRQVIAQERQGWRKTVTDTFEV